MLLTGDWGRTICEYVGYLRLLSQFLIFLFVLNMYTFWLGSTNLLDMFTLNFWLGSSESGSLTIAKFNALVLGVTLGIVLPMIAYCKKSRTD